MFKSFFVLPFFITSLGAATIIPFERDVPRVDKYDYITSNNRESKHFRNMFGADDQGQLYYRGFGIQNLGPNHIVPTIPENLENPGRDYYFGTDDRARRDTYLWVTDYNGSGRISDFAETILFFLPRNNQFHVEEQNDSLSVTLSTGEEVSFFTKYKTLNGGVLEEAPLDLHPDRAQRKHAQINYSGKGTIIRSDAWGADPRLAKNVQVLKAGLPACRIAGNVFWTQEGFPKFKFTRDEDAYSVILAKCGKGYLPE